MSVWPCGRTEHWSYVAVEAIPEFGGLIDRGHWRHPCSSSGTTQRYSAPAGCEQPSKKPVSTPARWRGLIPSGCGAGPRSPHECHRPPALAANPRGPRHRAAHRVPPRRSRTEVLSPDRRSTAVVRRAHRRLRIRGCVKYRVLDYGRPRASSCPTTLRLIRFARRSSKITLETGRHCTGEELSRAGFRRTRAAGLSLRVSSTTRRRAS